MGPNENVIAMSNEFRRKFLQMCSNRNVQKCQVLMRKNVDMLAGVCTDTIIG